jgi:glycosyltransferase involved in cell wall biosynthesis
VRIAFLTRSLVSGGAERQLSLLAKGLARRGHRCTILTFYGAPTPIEGVHVVALEKRGRWDTIGWFGRLLAALRRERPDVLHGYLPVANVMASATRLAFPWMKIVYGVRASDMARDRYDRLSRVAYRLEAAISRAADLVIANSAAGRRHVIAMGMPAERTIVIRNGIDTEFFQRDEAAAIRIRASLGIAPSQKLVGLVGRADPMKDHATFIRAFTLASHRAPDLRAAIVGSQISPKVAAGNGPSIAMLGWRDDLPALYSAFDLCCLSSAFGEGVPNAVAEAMACETPCVVTKVGDSDLLVGDTGIVVPPRDADALAAAILRLAGRTEAERRIVGAAARARITHKFSQDRLIDETERALLSLIVAR